MKPGQSQTAAQGMAFPQHRMLSTNRRARQPTARLPVVALPPEHGAEAEGNQDGGEGAGQVCEGRQEWRSRPGWLPGRGVSNPEAAAKLRRSIVHSRHA